MDKHRVTHSDTYVANRYVCAPYVTHPTEGAADGTAKGITLCMNKRMKISASRSGLTQGAALHRDLAAPLAVSGVDVVFACGPLMRNLFDALPAALRGSHRETAAAITDLLRSGRAGLSDRRYKLRVAA